MAVRDCEQTWSGNAYRRIYPGYIPPAEAEERYYAQFDKLDMVAWDEVISLRQTGGGSYKGLIKQKNNRMVIHEV